MLLIECDLDEHIVKRIGIPKSKIIHESGKGEISIHLKLNQGTVGLVDEDPNSSQPQDFENYEIIEDFGNLSLRKKNAKNAKFLIIIKPRLEEWLIRCGDANNIDIQKYGFSKDGDHIHNIPHLEKSKKFYDYLEKFISIDSEIQKLKEWLNHILVI